MGVNAEMAGKEYPPAEPYEVGREKIREFAQAINATSAAHTDPEAARALGHPDVIAPPTFACVISQRAEFALMVDPAVGIDFAQVVHGEENFVHHRPIVAGDTITATLTIERVRSAGGNAMVTSKTELTDAKGEPVSTVRSTIVIRGGGAS